MSVLEFWTDHKIDIEFDELRQNSVSVKGKSYQNPFRGLEIFGNLEVPIDESNQDFTLEFSDFTIQASYLQFQSGLNIPFGKGIYHPPFIWQDCSPKDLSINFTYITNVFYRILSSLADQNLIATDKIDSLLDEACRRLSIIYKLQEGFIMKHINNTLNMYLISKITENLVGRKIYKCEYQEPILTYRSLEQTLNSIDTYFSASILQQMSLSLGRGVTFSENFLADNQILNRTDKMLVEERTNSYLDNSLVIDHRRHLIKRVQVANTQGINISMCAILDDTSETVFDLLWIQQLLERCKYFKVNLLLNRAQVSINFSSFMFKKILSNKSFLGLAKRLHTQLFIYEIFCPLISFQTNILTQNAWNIINGSDFIYVKGLNFFETCQIKGKDTYHAFIVYGNVSRLYTGLKDYDAVFAFIPQEKEGLYS